MLFRLCDHYDDNYPIVDNNQVDIYECFICFEIINKNDLRYSKLNKQSMFIKNCKCDGNIHKKCLKIWFDTNRSCPICRTNVIEKNCVSFIVVNFIPFGNYIYLKFYNLLFSMSRLIFFLFFLYNIFDFYLECYLFNSKIYEDYTYQNNVDYSYYQIYYYINESSSE
jgi:hypothetical protein